MKNEVFLGYATHPVLGKVVSGRRPAKKHPHNTRLDSGRGTVQMCCKCFKLPTKGSCGAHTAEVYVRLMAAEAALKEADKRIEALEGAFFDSINLSPSPLRKALEVLIELRHLPLEAHRPKPAVLS